MAIAVEATQLSTSDDFNFTCPSGTNVLILGYSRGRSQSGHQWATYNGVDMIRQEERAISTAQDMVIDWFWMPNPPTGSSHAVNVQNKTASYDGLFAIALSGADPLNPFRGVNNNNGDR